MNNHIILYYIYIVSCIITALNRISRQTFNSSAHLRFIWNNHLYVSVDDHVNIFKFHWNISSVLQVMFYTQYINYIIKCCYKLIYSVTNNCYIVTGGDHNVKPWQIEQDVRSNYNIWQTTEAEKAQTPQTNNTATILQPWTTGIRRTLNRKQGVLKYANSWIFRQGSYRYNRTNNRIQTEYYPKERNQQRRPSCSNLEITEKLCHIKQQYQSGSTTATKTIWC